nr:unnamed protein product [Callosobruchus chinensis]
MDKNTLIFLPSDLEGTGYLRGVHKCFEETQAYYVTYNRPIKHNNQAIGYIGKDTSDNPCRKALLFVNNITGNIQIFNDHANPQTVIKYDYEGFRNSELILRNAQDYGKHFKTLTEELRKHRSKTSQNGKYSLTKTGLLFLLVIIDCLTKLLSKLEKVVSCSHTFTYFGESLKNLKWFIEEILQEKKLNPKLGNALTAKIIDVLIGVILMNWFLHCKDEILYAFQNAVEIIISNLKGLLIYLMGSPIGLKLNHAFNRCLGQFFFYHISLWRLFLHGIQPLFASNYQLLVFPGILGFSFQLAMIADIISIATFHVYCIYVYAARLFNLQLRGIVSLWRLFIGRKYNPLRNRVDSCQYSLNQLSIGTMGFTVLLFLLPTTTLYYAVFSMFRLLILSVNALLQCLRYLLNALPIYVTCLWILRSSSVAGTVCISWKHNEDSFYLEARLNLLPLISSIKKFTPDSLNYTRNNQLSQLLHCALTGRLI